VLDPSAYLAGGVAVAMRLRHRLSKDLDVFVSRDDLVPDPTTLPRGSRVTARAPGTLYVEIGGVPTSVIRYAYPLLAPLERLKGSALALASLEDLGCMKLSAIASRGAMRDFWDLHEILRARDVPLDRALVEYQRKYVSDDVGHVVRSLVYFGDADTAPRPEGLSAEQWKKIKSDFRRWVRAL
jgi:hypothetical protein